MRKYPTVTLSLIKNIFETLTFPCLADFEFLVSLTNLFTEKKTFQTIHKICNLQQQKRFKTKVRWVSEQPQNATRFFYFSLPIIYIFISQNSKKKQKQLKLDIV